MKYIFIYILLLIPLAACSPVDKIVKETNAKQAILIDKENKVHLVDLNKTKIVPSCEERKKMEEAMKTNKDETKNTLCKSPFNFTGLDKMIHKELGNKKIDSMILILTYPGSKCRTIYDYANAIEYEICSPPYPPF